MQRISKNYKRVDTRADDFKNKTNFLKLNEQSMHRQSKRIQTSSFQSRIPTHFRTRTFRNN